MELKSKSFTNKKELKNIFEKTFSVLNEKLPNGIVRGNRINITPIVLYEAISVGIADAINENLNIDAIILINILDDEKLKTLTTGATNSRNKLYQRIDYVKEKFLL